MTETESGLIAKEPIKKEKKGPDFATLILESGKDIYRDDPDKKNRKGLSALKGVIPDGAMVQIRVNFARPEDFLPCAVLKIWDFSNRERKVLTLAGDKPWEIESSIKIEEKTGKKIVKKLKIRSWVFVNRYSLRHRQRRLREAKRPDFKQPRIFNFPKDK